MKKVVYSLLLAGVFQVNAQESGSVKVSEAYVLPGSSIQLGYLTTVEEFRDVVPESSILQNDYSAYKRGNGVFNVYHSAFNAGIGLTFGGKVNPVLRLGISYFNRTNLSLATFKDDSYVYDTLTSSQTGISYFIDSVVHRRLKADQRTDYLNLDASVVFRTNPENRWLLYGGVGLSLGMGFNSVVTISLAEYVEDWTIDGYEDSDIEIKAEETHRIGGSFLTSAYLPLGFDFRIGKKREFWRHIHLVSELRPSMVITSVQDFGLVTTVGTQSTFGLKFDF